MYNEVDLCCAPSSLVPLAIDSKMRRGINLSLLRHDYTWSILNKWSATRVRDVLPVVTEIYALAFKDIVSNGSVKKAYCNTYIILKTSANTYNNNDIYGNEKTWKLLRFKYNNFYGLLIINCIYKGEGLIFFLKIYIFIYRLKYEGNKISRCLNADCCI